MRPARRYTIRTLALAASLAAVGAARDGGGGGGNEPTPAAPSLLEQLNRETQSLYTNVSQGVVRVQLPAVPAWIRRMAAKDDPLEKWGPVLSPEVKEKLAQDRRAAEQGKLRFVGTQVVPATQLKQSPESDAGAANGPGWKVSEVAGGNTVILQSTGSREPVALQIRTGGDVGPDGRIQPNLGPRLSFQPVGSFAPNNVGLVLDSAGHVLVPLYLEKEDVPDGVKASVGGAGGPVISASFVASDRQSNVTLLKLPEGVGKPVRLGPRRPTNGSLVMLLSPSGGGSRLLVWADNQPDLAGIAVAVDGSVSGFARFGQFLSTAAFQNVADQLVQTGQVKRAVLGMGVAQVGPSDVARDNWPALAGKPAIRVQDVGRDSTAAKAGLRRGDLILTLAGEPVGDPTTLAALLAGRSGAATFHLLRNGQPLDVQIELAPE